MAIKTVGELKEAVSLYMEKLEGNDDGDSVGWWMTSDLLEIIDDVEGLTC